MINRGSGDCVNAVDTIELEPPRQEVYEEGDLHPEATHRELLSVRCEAKLDGFLPLNERDILTHAGRMTHEEAVGHATQEYDAFHRERLAEKAAQPDDFDQAVRALPAAKPARKKKRRTP